MDNLIKIWGTLYGYFYFYVYFYVIYIFEWLMNIRTSQILVAVNFDL